MSLPGKNPLVLGSNNRKFNARNPANINVEVIITGGQTSGIDWIVVAFVLIVVAKHIPKHDIGTLKGRIGINDGDSYTQIADTLASGRMVEPRIQG